MSGDIWHRIFFDIVLFLFIELGGAVQLMGIIRLLIDPENMLGTTNVRELHAHNANISCTAHIYMGKNGLTTHTHTRMHTHA